eukprot:Blabericola_migrator_1__6753@NODE_3411_length_1796_cov_449_620590_g1991_i1_p1_GENE_NODE_3411_length_1796_cov_449_620590_g1991_i1NODE_3411_length_1796_cov_449_620590_g1991_i1_p1_ORF_typecomplete_len500_score72_96MFS_1/PF07690_16/2_4e02MFS_1/PF07690_16/9_1e23Sugar_tr/PF00083_24/1_9e12TRI12/PF06609_13/2_9e02TRI12/PF06609_13/4e06TRI12/PF06609_13/1_1e03TRI12/PF06609_13/4_2e02Folate_carrier/PF01770_18/2_4e05MFS_4/PF06779_14/6e03MFS_4/PF06779_14/2_2e05MFS_4/PF06779_14/0_19MFS_5/PF05631_14/0_0024MFS_5/P
MWRSIKNWVDDFPCRIWDADVRLRTWRWVFVPIYGLSLVTMACVSFSWQQYSLILYEGKAYEWLCTPQEIADRPVFGSAACLQQDKRVGDLYSLLTTAQAASGALAGIVVDHLGRRTCATLGVVLSMISIVLLVVSSESFQALPAAIVIDGLSCNLIAFPTLVLADYFPNHPVAATSFVLTAELGGAVVCPILLALWRKYPHWSYESLWYVFAFGVTLPLGVLYMVTLPPLKFSRRKNNEEEDQYATRVENDNKSGTDDTVVSETLDYVAVRRQSVNGIEPNGADVGDLDVSDVEEKRKGHTKESLKAFVRDLKSYEFWNFEIIFNLFMLQHTFYPVILRDMSGDDIAEYQGLFQMSQAFWCLSCGAACDYCCTATAATLLSLTSVAFLLLSLVPSHGFQYFVVSIFTVAHSYVYAIRFTFVREAFGPEHRGKILGAIGIGSAVTTLLNIPINRTTRYMMWCIIMTGFSVLQIPSLWYLYRRYKESFHYRVPGKVLCKK